MFVVFLLPFAGFFRIEEVLRIKYGDITFHDCYVAIQVDKSKTDQLRKGNEVVISRSSSQDACPVSIFKRYLSELERFPVEPSHYVFKPLTKSKLGHKFVSTIGPKVTQLLRSILRVVLRILCQTLLFLALTT